MKRALAKIAVAFVAACLLNRAYNDAGWHYFDMPFPDIIAPIFGWWADAHYDAVEIEWLIEFFLVGLAVVFGADWLLQQSKSN